MVELALKTSISVMFWILGYLLAKDLHAFSRIECGMQVKSKVCLWLWLGPGWNLQPEGAWGH
jgi:hypothetical protein